MDKLLNSGALDLTVWFVLLARKNAAIANFSGNIVNQELIRLKTCLTYTTLHYA